ncbi:hypothetical protein ACHAPJ_005878 [Fusarium lateritium]
MKLHQVTAILAFVATGVIATPAGFPDRNNDKDNKSPSKGDYGHNNNGYGGNRGDGKHDGKHGDYGHDNNGYGGNRGDGKHGEKHGDKHDDKHDGKHGDKHDDKHDGKHGDKHDGKHNGGNYGGDRGDGKHDGKHGDYGHDNNGYGHGNNGYGGKHDGNYGHDNNDNYGYGGKHGDKHDGKNDGKHGGNYGNNNNDNYGYGGKHGGKHGDKGQKYNYDLERCDWQPYNAKSWLGYGDNKGRHGNGFKRPCPEDKKKCKKYDYDYSKATYSTSFSEYKQCPKGDSYKVTGKIGPCGDYGYGGYGKEQCLIVEYKDWDKWSDKTAYLGVYATEDEGPKKKEKLNFNDKCHKNKCVVPVKELPGYRKFKDSVWVGIDDDQCKDSKPHWGGYDGKKGHKDDDDEDNYDDKKGDHGDKKRKDYDNDDDEDNYDNKKGRYGNKDYDNDYNNDYDNNDDDNDYSRRGGRRGGRRDEVKYIEVEIEAKYSKKCTAWCCNV